MRLCALQLTSFEELRVQVGQAASDGVSKPAAADPVVGLDAQVATQRALRTTMMAGERTREERRMQTVRDKGGMKTDGEFKKRMKRFDQETEERWRRNTDRNESSASLSRANKLCRDSEEGKITNILLTWCFSLQI